MKKNSRANKGQFSVIAALLVSVILVTAVISTYTMVRHAPLQDSPKVLTAIGETNKDIKRILDFTVGYYGSILRVTGNSTYAKGLTTSYLSSGLVNIARSHPEWNPSFTLDFEQDDVSTRWFMPESYSMGTVSVKYSLDALGIYDINFTTSSALNVEMLSSSPGEARLNVTCDNSEPELGLSKENFWFYKYTDDSTWELVNPTEVLISSNGIYTMDLPSGVNQDAYSVQVEDRRGLIVPAFYSQESVASESKIPHYTYTIDWVSTGVLDIYEDLSTDTFAIELLQNGTLKWLGQPLELTSQERPIPPVSNKAFRVNATVNGNNLEVPFQIEDWASDYMVPLGLAGNESIFSNNNMIVFLVNDTVDEITLWWDGNDIATQTPNAWENKYFNDNPGHSSYGVLNNGVLELNVHNFYIDSIVDGTGIDCRSNFMRVNYPDGQPQYGDQLTYVIYNGIVRDIVQQEPEYSNGVDGCSNFYTQVYLTLPANAPYFTYAARTIFVDSVGNPRDIDDLSVIQLSDLDGDPLTEDGASGGYPVDSDAIGSFSDGSPSGSGVHHWSQFSSGISGAGLMFMDNTLDNLYAFDGITGSETGALFVNDWSNQFIEFNPVDDSLNHGVTGHTDPLDVTWYGAVVTFNGEPIYTSPEDGHVGLWVMVEHPPSVLQD